MEHQARAQMRPQVGGRLRVLSLERPRRHPAQAAQCPPQPLGLGGQGWVGGQVRFKLRPPRLVQPAFQIRQEPFVILCVPIEQKPYVSPSQPTDWRSLRQP